MSTVAAAPARTSLRAPVRVREFRLFWLGFTASLVADQLSLVGLAWLALQLTGSPLATGGVLTAAAVPRGALGLLGGAVADRFGPRKVGVLTSAARVITMGSLAALAVTGTARMLEVYALAFLFGAGDAFYGPTRGSLLPRTVPAEQLEAANSIEGSTQALANLVGPAVAGLLVAKAGAGFALAGDAGLYVLVTVATAALRVGAADRGDGDARLSIWADVLSGLRYVWHDPVLRTLIIVASAMTVAVTGPIDVGLTALARYRLGGPIGLGVMFAGFGAGSLAGSLLAGMLPPGRVLNRLVAVGLVFAVGMPLLGVAPNLPVALALTLVMGVAAGLINVIATTWLMRRTDQAMMGRLFSVIMVTQVSMSPLSLAGAGALAQVGVPFVFAAAGAVMLVGAAAAATWLRSHDTSRD